MKFQSNCYCNHTIYHPKVSEYGPEIPQSYTADCTVKKSCRTSCADPGIFVRGGGGPGQSDKKALATFFLVLSLFYRSQIVNFKENYHLQGSGGGPTFSRVWGQHFPGGGGGVQLLIP